MEEVGNTLAAVDSHNLVEEDSNPEVGEEDSNKADRVASSVVEASFDAALASVEASAAMAYEALAPEGPFAALEAACVELREKHIASGATSCVRVVVDA